MKKIILLITLLILFSFRVYSQNKMVFKVEYKPQTTYTQTTEQTSENETSYIGSNEFLEKLKSKGIENPTIKKTNFITKNINRTGKLIKNSYIPLSIEFIEFPIIDAKDMVPNGTIVYCKIPTKYTPIIDSIYSPKMDNDFKQVFLKSIQNLFAQLLLPEKKLKIGDSFTREIPLTIPVGEITFKTTNTIIYKLSNITDNKAFFDISQDFTFDVSGNNENSKASGSGKGQIIYDIKNTFYLKYQLDSNMEMEIDKGDFKLKVLTKNNYTQNTVITQN